MPHKDDDMKLSEKKLLKQIIKESILVKIIADMNEGHISSMASKLKGLFTKPEEAGVENNEMGDTKDEPKLNIQDIPETKRLWELIGKKQAESERFAQQTGQYGFGFDDKDIEEFTRMFRNLAPQEMKIVLDFYKSFKEPAYDSMIKKFEDIYVVKSASKGGYR